MRPCLGIAKFLYGICSGASCSGLLIPDTDLGENPRRERGV